MGKFVECVPNFSEGKDAAKIEAIVNAAALIPGVVILDVEKDPDHNRTVLSFIAPLETAVDAAFAAAKKAAELIDLNHHKGEHPRMGAMDVVPFIPILDTPAEECVKLAGTLAEKIGRELNIPVYLYDLAARREDRRDLAKVRKGQFEGLKEEIGKNPDRVPDFGPDKIHPTAGAVAIGARKQIINFNVNLNAIDMDFSKNLAKKIRTSGGGLPNLRAKEIFLESKKQVQISTVLTDYKTTSIKRVMDEIEKEIKPRGIEVTDTELIGLTTQESLINYATESIKVSNFNPETQILENRFLKLTSMWQFGVNMIIEALSNTDPTPGGGSAAGIAGAMGCALGQMAIGISVRSKKLEESKRQVFYQINAGVSGLKQRLQNLINEDCKAFDKFMEVRKLPKESPERKSEMQKALKQAAEVPLLTARTAAAAIVELNKCGGISPSVISDYKSAKYLLETAIKCAAENVFINIEMIEDKEFCEKMT
ncbi:MAG: glutamate formimidoyltransferase [Elusimicrobia bacterium]|nr:glutamate formimidoyltransferase [Elusimicrobiota bacterium]